MSFRGFVLGMLTTVLIIFVGGYLFVTEKFDL